MARHMHTLACLVVLLAVTSSEKEQSRWSRQISSYTADISDWVPLASPVHREPLAPKINTPIKRQAIAEPRILTEPFPGFARPTGFGQETFPSRTYFNSPANRQLYLQSVPSAPQNYLTDQGFGQSIRFGLSQPNYPLNQGFAAPQYTFESAPAIKPRPAQPPQPANPIKFESFPKQNIAPIQQTKPFINQVPKLKPEEPKFIDDSSKKKAQSLQKLKFDSFEKLPKNEPIPPKPKPQKEEVQLLYVPLEQLNRGQFNFRGPIAAPQIINSDLYSQGLPKIEPLKQMFASDFQRPASKPIENFGSAPDYYGNFDSLKDFDQVPKFSTLTSPFPTLPPTTPKPKKLKPHQPPLAIFQEAKKNSQIKVGDVLSSLKNADTIAVLDTVNPLNAPKVFIGPSSLTPPEGFAKFELPYLSNIENTDKKLRQLPFFVAPLSYNTPNGFAKIPFPSPHVGSVVINSLIKENPSTHQTQPTYSTPPAFSAPHVNAYKEQSYKQEKPVTQRPSFNYYSTLSPKTNAPITQQSNYYSFEPQTVTSLSPPSQPQPVNQAPQKGTYFLSNVNSDQYNPQYVNFPSQNDYRNQEPASSYTPPKPETTTTLRTTTTTTTPKPSTYSSQLLETHNPYSINQAFHFSTPLDYHSYFDEFKDTYAPPGVSLELPKGSTRPVSSTSAPTKAQEITTQKPKQQTSPSYVQNYSPEIQYQSEIPDNRYSVFNDYTTKPDVSTEQQLPPKTFSAENIQQINNQNLASHYIDNVESQPAYENLTETIINRITGPSSDVDNPQIYEQYETNYNANDFTNPATSTTTSRTTTTTRRPIRGRGRPRYTTARPNATEATYSTTRATYTRKPLRERRPLPPRSRYEPNKISSEKTTKKSVDSNESTTKSSRTRTRGRIQFKPSDNDEFFDKKNRVHGSKEQDLAYQRDILHQNYPVTLMERASTIDIEAITEPTSPKISSTRTLETAPAENYDTENAYAHESAAISQLSSSDLREEIPNYTSRVETQYEDNSAPKYSTRNEEAYQARSSAAPTQSLATHEESMEKQEDFPRHTTPVQRIEKPEISSYATESVSYNTEQPSYSVNVEQNQEEITTNQDTEISKVGIQEDNVEEQPEENIVQTTPSYNRVRVRPGVIRQYHQASSTESSKTKTDRRRPIQAITYRPAFDKRRTTMRIDEIEADLKTKQVHARPEVQDYRHPVYKPDPSTEGSTAATTQETTKRGHFRRRRPTYTTTSTESSSTKKIYEVKNRFRGRRPTTEKPIDKAEAQTESTSTVRNTPYSRYSHRPRLSERYNKKPEPEQEETEDQDSNYSINIPKYLAAENEQWSPKISSESFKPYNPNDIVDETKLATTERRSDRIEEGELDIITAKNDYDDILISVTPSTNNRGVKKIPDIPPTLEALVEQSKTTKSDSTDNMSTFETMLEEVMKSLEEQDKDEYTSNVMKHKGGEIGEIPPEKVITSDDEYAAKSTSALNQEVTTVEPTAEDTTTVNEEQQKGSKVRRRGFWKKVKVRPVNTESIEVAESQYYPNTVNRLGESVKKGVHEKTDKQEKPRVSVTTYKPNIQLIKDMLDAEDASAPEAESIADIDIPKIDKKKNKSEDTQVKEEEKKTTPIVDKSDTSEKPTSVGEEDLGTGSPDPTLIDNMYYSTPTEPTASESMFGMLNKADGFSLMDYLFGTTSSDSSLSETKNETVKIESKRTTVENIEITTEQPKTKIITTETSYIPEEITSVPSEENTETLEEFDDIRKVIEEEQPKQSGVTESPSTDVATSESSFMNPTNIVSTSMSTEISHETEICFRGKCIKTSKDIL